MPDAIFVSLSHTLSLEGILFAEEGWEGTVPTLKNLSTPRQTPVWTHGMGQEPGTGYTHVAGLEAQESHRGVVFESRQGR